MKSIGISALNVNTIRTLALSEDGIGRGLFPSGCWGELFPHTLHPTPHTPPQRGLVKLIDFGIATPLSRTNPTFRNPNVLEGTLAYIYRLLNDLENMFQLNANNRGLHLLFERTVEVPQYVRTDEVKLRQVLINLLSNAINFTKAGSVSLKVKSKSEQQITLRQAQGKPNNKKQTTITFEIEDTGVKIAPDELDSIFKAFVQAKAILALDIERIETCIAQIRELNAPVAEAIAVLAKGFKYKQLLTLMQPATD